MLNLLMPLPVLDLPKRNRRNPSNRISRHANLSIQFIDLFEGKALRLIDHEIHEDDAHETASAPDEEDLGLEVGVSGAPVDEVGG